jgi:hypothetical protein
MHFARPKLRLVAVVAAACAMAACATPPAAPVEDPFSRALPAAPAPLRPAIELTEREGPRNAVRNLTDLAVLAMREEQYAVAERALDAAIARIDSFLPDDVNAARAKSRFHSEDVKDFKGEPYERAMVYYYRGLLFARTGDFQNARAAFLAGGWQAAVSAQEKFGKTFGLMSLLGAWASRCEGDAARAQDLVAAATKEDPSLAAVLPVGTSLVLFESGAAPVKQRGGKHGEILTFGDGGRLDKSPSAFGEPAFGKKPAPWRVQLAKAADLSVQATSRDGRPIQGILDGKAQFKDTTEAVGVTATAIGHGLLAGNLYGNRDVANAGLIGLVIGLGATIASKATKPEADTRQIRLLPNEVHLASTDALMAAPVQVAPAGAAEVGTRLLAANERCQLHWGSGARGSLSNGELQPDGRRADAARQPAFRNELAAIVSAVSASR